MNGALMSVVCVFFLVEQIQYTTDVCLFVGWLVGSLGLFVCLFVWFVLSCLVLFCLSCLFALCVLFALFCLLCLLGMIGLLCSFLR